MLDNRFVLQESSGNVQFITDSQANTITLEVSNIKGQFYCDKFRYKETIFVAKGSIEVDLRDIKVTAGIKFGKTLSSDEHLVSMPDERIARARVTARRREMVQGGT